MNLKPLICRKWSGEHYSCDVQLMVTLLITCSKLHIYACAA